MRSDAIRQLAPPKIRAWLEYWDTHPEAIAMFVHAAPPIPLSISIRRLQREKDSNALPA